MANNNNIKRMITEEGIVLSKEYVEPRAAWTNYEGKTFEARPEKYIIKCASGEDIKSDVGLIGVNFLEYEVTKEIFENVKYLQKVLCKFEFSSYGLKPQAVLLMK